MTSPDTFLNLDILLDHLLPILSASDLNHLGATSHAFRQLINGPDGDIVWQRKIARDFNFPLTNTARRTGWRTLYRSLNQEECWVWGSAGHGRLGILQNPYNRVRDPINGAVTIPTLLSVKYPLVGIEASGWGTHALSQGRIVVWGCLDGESFAPNGAPYSNPSYIIRSPQLIPTWRQLGSIDAIACGRKHVIAKNTEGAVWEYYNFGETYQVKGGWDESDRIIAVEAGWACSLALTKEGRVYVWWKYPKETHSRLANEARSNRGGNERSIEGVTYNLDVETVELPSLPERERGVAQEKIVKIACADSHVFALSSSSRLYVLNIAPIEEHRDLNTELIKLRLENAFLTGEREWAYLDKFSDMDIIRSSNAVFNSVSPSARITHISAHFHSFAVYSVGLSSLNDSIVLIGDNRVTNMTEPEVIPVLQQVGVIKISKGDYHWGALTSSGECFSWGAFNSGALGLGHPALPNTPLSAITSTSLPPPPTAAAPPTGHYQMPGFFPFTVPSIRRPIQIAVVQTPPRSVDNPTRVRFPDEKEPGQSEGKGEGEGDVEGEGEAEGEREDKGRKFVFQISMGGSHSVALAITL